MQNVPEKQKRSNRTVCVSILKDLFSYDPVSGVVTRKSDQSTRARKGDIVGFMSAEGYLTVGIKRKTYKLHRVIWAMHHGVWPTDDVDHINGIRSDNRICNLRAATRAENSRNKVQKSGTASGLKGVVWNKNARKWMALIAVGGKRHYLGYYDNPSAAHQAYRDAAVHYHGEFANLGSGK